MTSHSQVIRNVLSKSQYKDSLEIVSPEKLIKQCRKEIPTLDIEFLCSTEGTIEPTARANDDISLSSEAKKYQDVCGPQDLLSPSGKVSLDGSSSCVFSRSDLDVQSRLLLEKTRSSIHDHCPTSVDSLSMGTTEPQQSLEAVVGEQTAFSTRFKVRAEKTQYGMIFLPDVSNFGPLFVCGIRRIS